MPDHPVFVAPPDVNVRVWRYMDFTKYVALLENRALYFARADQFDDPFEGASTKANVGARAQWYTGPEWGPGEGANLRRTLTGLYEASRTWTYVNCWHANEVESAAMWRLYARSSDAIAIQSTYAKLAAELPEHTFVGVVQYIDYDNEFIPDFNLFYRFMHKRRSFAHEQEVRAVRAMNDHFDTGNVEVDVTKPNPLLGIQVPVNITRLVERVFVAPTAPAWFGSIVERVTKRYELDLTVVRSSLDEKPVY